jgi:hypothetical protein
MLRESMCFRRRKEYPRLKHIEGYQRDPEPWTTIYKGVSNTAVSGLTERSDGKQYPCGDNRRHQPYKTTRKRRSGQFVSTYVSRQSETKQNNSPTAASYRPATYLTADYYPSTPPEPFL